MNRAKSGVAVFTATLLVVGLKPITFACREMFSLAPEKIAEQILDLTKWPDFRGYGPIPGIKSAEFETRTPNVVGSRIRVTNLDGSTHVEEIVEWQPDRRIQLRMGNFSKPLSRLRPSDRRIACGRKNRFVA